MRRCAPRSLSTTLRSRFLKVTFSSSPAPPRSSPPSWCELITQNVYCRHFVRCQPAGGGATPRDYLDCGEHAFAHIRFVSANGQLHFHFIRNDVVLGPAVDGTNGNDNGIDRIVLATPDRLPLIDHFRSEDDWIFCSIRITAVTPNPVNGDINRVDVGTGVTLGYPDVADF